MDTNKLDQTIIYLTKIASSLTEKWAFVGSTASYVEGQNIIPSDIDIMTTKKGVEYFVKKLKQYIVVDMYFDDSKKGSSWYTKFIINDLEVEIMGELTVKGDHDMVSTPKDAKIWQYLNSVDFQGLKMSVFPDEFQIVTNATSTSREFKVAEQAKFMLERGYRKDLINYIIKENNLSNESVDRIKKYLPI